MEYNRVCCNSYRHITYARSYNMWSWIQGTDGICLKDIDCGIDSCNICYYLSQCQNFIQKILIVILKRNE